MSSDCSSIPDAKFFNDKYTYPVWFTRKKMIFHNKMLRRLKKLRFLHSRSSQYYETMNIKLSAPSIVITALSGIASFLSTSQYVDEDAQNACGITVGVLASVASVFQAFTAACQYSAKKEAHRTVAEQYNALIVKTKFEMEMPNEEDFIDKLEVAILEIDAKCNYFVPQFIIKEWEEKEAKEEGNRKQSTKSVSDSMNIGLFEPEPELDNIEPLNNVSISVRESVKRKEPDETSALLNSSQLPKTYSSSNLNLESDNIKSINVSRDDIVLRIPVNESDLDEVTEDEQNSKPNNSSNV